MKAVIISEQDGEWEGLFIDGVLVSEGHTLGEGDVPGFWLDIAHKYDLKSKELHLAALNDADNSRLSDAGGLPATLAELNGEYGSYRLPMVMLERCLVCGQYIGKGNDPALCSSDHCRDSFSLEASYNRMARMEVQNASEQA